MDISVYIIHGKPSQLHGQVSEELSLTESGLIMQGTRSPLFWTPSLWRCVQMLKMESVPSPSKAFSKLPL